MEPAGGESPRRPENVKLFNSETVQQHTLMEPQQVCGQYIIHTLQFAVL